MSGYDARQLHINVSSATNEWTNIRKHLFADVTAEICSMAYLRLDVKDRSLLFRLYGHVKDLRFPLSLRSCDCPILHATVFQRMAEHV